jgi:hypothetical protein
MMSSHFSNDELLDNFLLRCLLLTMDVFGCVGLVDSAFAKCNALGKKNQLP